MRDKYRNFAELAAAEISDRDYRISVASRESGIVIAAPHGGGIEPGTSEIAKTIGGDDFSLYLFEGIKRTGNRSALHITSSNFDEPQCIGLLKRARLILTIHGEDSDGDTVYIGGRYESGKHLLFKHLQQAEFAPATHPNQELQGLHPQNICNIGQYHAGLQLELAVGLRTSFFASLDRNGRATATPRLTKFTTAVREALLRAVTQGSFAEPGSR